MSMLQIEKFEAEWESMDDRGKRHRHPCTVVGVTDDEKLVILVEGDDGRIGTFTIEHVWPAGSR